MFYFTTERGQFCIFAVRALSGSSRLLVFSIKKNRLMRSFFMELVDGLDRIALWPSILLCCFARIAMLPGDPHALAKKCCAFFFTLVPSRVRAVSWSSP